MRLVYVLTMSSSLNKDIIIIIIIIIIIVIIISSGSIWSICKSICFNLCIEGVVWYCRLMSSSYSVHLC